MFTGNFRAKNMLNLRRQYLQLNMCARASASMQTQKTYDDPFRLMEPFNNRKRKIYFSTGLSVKNIPTTNYLNDAIFACETVNDLLEIVDNHLCSFQTDNLVKCVQTFEKIMYKTVCDTYPWASPDSRTALCVQTSISNECQRLFSQLVDTNVMRRLFEQIIKNNQKFSNHELVSVACALVRLHVPNSSAVLTAVCSQCIARHSTFDLDDLYHFSQLANHLGRSGFFLMGLIVKKFSEEIYNLPANPENYNKIGKLLGNVNYFCSADMIREIVSIYSNGGKLRFTEAELERVDVKNSVKILESLSRFGRITVLQYNGKFTAPLIWHLEKCVDKLSLFDLSRVKLHVALARQRINGLTKAIETRAESLMQSQIIKPVDIVSLLIIFVDAGREMTQKLEDLVCENVHKFDSLTLSSLSRQRLLMQAENPRVITAYSGQVLRCLPDLENSLTCFKLVVNAFCKLKTYPAELDQILSVYCLRKLEEFIPVYCRQVFSIYLLRQSLNSGYISPILLDTLTTQLPAFSTDGLLDVRNGIEKSKRLIRFPNRIIKSVRRSILDKLSTASDVDDLGFILSKFTLPTLLNYCPEISACVADKYTQFIPQINVSNLHLTSNNIREFKIYIPELLQKLVDLCIAEKDFIRVKTFLNVLRTLACFHYVPNEMETLENIFVSYLSHPDVNRVNMYDYVSGLLSMSMLGCYPEPLLVKVFSLGFLRKFDEFCADTNNPTKQQKALASLNRNVMLRLPHLNVPWFNKDFWRHSYLTKHGGQSVEKWKNEVHEQLMDIFGDDSSIGVNVYSDYYHFIDFEIYLDDKNNATSKHLNDWTTKVAIIILNPSSFCSNTRHLFNSVVTKIDELEILEYKVVLLPYYDLDSMHLSEKSSLMSYLKQKIFGEKTFL